MSGQNQVHGFIFLSNRQAGFKEMPNCLPAKRLLQSMHMAITNKKNWFGFLRQWTMVDEPCSCLRGGWQGCCSRRTLSALSCRDQGTQEDCSPFESALRNSSGGKAVNIEHYSYLIIVTSWFFGDKIVLWGICSLPLKRVPWYHRGPQSNRQSCPLDWCQRCPERQAWVRLSLYGGF